ncbi:hypothetical protein AC578_9854 [Pseudocercospora eumusae]|uniref:Uncharacterized protein n=1 Tax=Pseudocercospora eumusae TaxID=321146 RepID=A0A139HAZ4_9PEZI|nr:hypothetical protein AC578_9854 [Pseudocercospora eumusae]
MSVRLLVFFPRDGDESWRGLRDDLLMYGDGNVYAVGAIQRRMDLFLLPWQHHRQQLRLRASPTASNPPASKPTDTRSLLDLVSRTTSHQEALTEESAKCTNGMAEMAETDEEE